MSQEPVIRNGLFCNISGEGTDLCVMRITNNRIAIGKFYDPDDVLDFNKAKTVWKFKPFFYESESKVYFDYVPDNFKDKTIFDFHSEEDLNSETNTKYTKPKVNLFIQEDMIEPILETLEWPDEYKECYSNQIIAGYLAKNILNVTDPEEYFAFGICFGMVSLSSFETMLTGRGSAKEAHTSFLKSFWLREEAIEYFLECYNLMADNCYYASLSKSLGISYEEIIKRCNQSKNADSST